ncbi:DUF342 domain-containing protein [Pseudoalteromonas sp. BSi20495]|uniref:DUF342 domain-containing protein n=1 Tax=Pseudoalteromonas sp. BSi20495 TaxID=386429 RepID=UPI0002316383|nr:FapA family protein [Pseudoalteromonas sp. BSi20495]GAA80243.1 hypothetical protein P20495_2757 [Pseudoalteromonas sp. BSi20495]
MSVFSFNEETGYLSLIAHPVDSGFPITATQLIELLEQSDYCDFDVISANIGKLFSQSKDYKEESLIIAQAVNATVVINVDEKGMVAEATITTTKGGLLLSMEGAQKALADAGVKKGISPRALDSFLGQQFEQPAGSSYSAIIAHGRNPKDGKDARFVRLCSTAQDRVLSPQATQGGKVDMKNLGAIITVKPGTPLMQRIPATRGEDGYTIFGEIIPATPGKEHQLQPFEGTKIDPNNPDILIADCKGVPVALPRGMRVDDVLCFDNIDVSTGHVDFDGSVIISGDIKDGMHVKANGDITVIGFVESGIVESKSAVTIMQGAIGRKRENNEAFTCHITALRTISIGYAQYCNIKTEQDLFIERQALHCDMSARRLIRVGKADKPRGKIIGGNILDAMRIETGELGAPAGTKTRVLLAQNWFELRDKQIQIADFEKVLATKVTALKQARKKAGQVAEPTQRQQLLNKITENEQHIKARTEHVNRQKLLIKRKITQLLSSCRLKVNELMHPGVELKIAKDSKQFSRIYPPHLLKLNEGKITQSF